MRNNDDGVVPQTVIHFAKDLVQCGNDVKFLFEMVEQMIAGISTVRQNSNLVSISPHDVETEKSLQKISRAIEVCCKPSNNQWGMF